MKVRFFACIATAFVITAGCAPAGSATGAAPAAKSTETDWLTPLLAETSPATRAAVAADRNGFVRLVRSVLAADSDLIVLVDKATSLPADYVPPDLVAVADLKPQIAVRQAKPALQVRRVMVPALNQLFAEARAAGLNLWVASAYRSYEYQKGTFARNVAESGETEAARVSARPGHSQHQLGLAIDFNTITNEFAETAAGRWLAANAARFGFSLSYPNGAEGETGYAWESWHYRYIGVEACELQARFFDGSQQALLVFLDRNRAALAAGLTAEGAR